MPGKPEPGAGHSASDQSAGLQRSLARIFRGGVPAEGAYLADGALAPQPLSAELDLEWLLLKQGDTDDYEVKASGTIRGSPLFSGDTMLHGEGNISLGRLNRCARLGLKLDAGTVRLEARLRDYSLIEAVPPLRVLFEVAVGGKRTGVAEMRLGLAGLAFAGAEAFRAKYLGG